MSQKSESPKNLNHPKRGFKSHLKNLAIAGAVATTLIGISSCGKNNNESINPDRTKTEVTTKKQDVFKKHPNFVGMDADSRAITDSIEGIILCENPDTKQIFLSDGDNKLTEDFADIRDIGRFDGTIYFIGINEGKPAIINEKGDTIFSGLDTIKKYTILNGNIAVSGTKNGKTCLLYNNKIIDEGHEYEINVNDDYSKNGIYTTATSYGNNQRYVSMFVNGKKVGPNFSYEYIEDGAFNGNNDIRDYGNGYIIISDKYSDDGTLNGTLIYNGKTIGTNLKDLGRVNSDSELISYIKNGKKYILNTDGKEYLVNMNRESNNDIKSNDSNILFVNDGKKSYYIFNGELHEYEGKYEFIKHIGRTSDGELYFIGSNDKGENFVLDGKKYGPLEHITGVGKTKDGTIYLRGWQEETRGHTTFVKTPVILINGTIREVDINETGDTQERLKIGEGEDEFNYYYKII